MVIVKAKRMPYLTKLQPRCTLMLTWQVTSDFKEISQKVTVNILNGQTVTFETMPIDVELVSLDGRTSKTVGASTTERVTGNLEAIDWRKHANKWPHLRGIDFPKPGPHPLVDILTGVDHVDLHYSFKNVKGRPCEPVPRLTPLG